ncbi:MAG: hypothetical protein K6B75_06405 [Lachnospiraceae bacterium]|nr:hypothetical protein [Lachnospiraceae bacterium]
MQERAKELLKKLLEYWNKWTTKQKTIIVSVAAGAILLIGIFVAVLSRTKYVMVYEFENTKAASNAVTLLRDNTITTKLGSDNVSVLVDQDSYSDALMVLATNDVSGEDFTMADLLDTGITTTNAEYLVRQHLYLKDEMIRAVKKVTGVSDVTISYVPKDTSNRILVTNKETPVSVMLVTTGSFNSNSAETIATYINYAVGNSDPKSVTVVDHKGQILYDGTEDEESKEISVYDRIALEEHYDEKYKDEITGALLLNGFTEVDVVPHLDINYDKVEELFEEYIPLTDEIYGVLIERHTTDSTGTTTGGDVPGTDSNDEPDYYISESGGGTTSSSTEDLFYQPSKKVTNKIYDLGVISDDSSSITVTAVKVNQVTEELLRRRGLLEEVSYEDFKANNSELTFITDENKLNNYISVISMATGISANNIHLSAYEVFDFTEEPSPANWSFILQIVLAVLLLGFLLFVIIRGLSPVEVMELEPELSVEQLLATTKDNQSLDDIEFSEQSETRKMIEKFFDENPEAVAQLLRNWLNDDWE